MTGHAFTIRHEFAIKFLESMGIDHSKVRYIKLEMGLDIITTVEIEYIMEDSDLKDLSELKKTYKLTLKEL